MKRLTLLFLLLSPLVAQAQISSPAFDPQCYFPRLGVPAEFDTVYGQFQEQGLGRMLIPLPPRPGKMYGDVLVGGLRNISPPFLGAIETGPAMNLHKLKVNHVMNWNPRAEFKGYYHIRSKDYWDMLVEDPYQKILWQDDSGNYDFERSTILWPYGGPVDGEYGGGPESAPCILNLTSDSHQDVVMFYSQRWKDFHRDSTYLAFWNGDSIFAQGDTARPTTFTYAYDELLGSNWGFYQANFRTGVYDDVLAAGRGRTYIVSPDGNSTVNDFLNALRDSILFTDRAVYNPTSARVLPRPQSDPSVELLFPVLTGDGRSGIGIFRGGPEFGRHPITVDSVAFVIESPEKYDPNFAHKEWGTAFVNTGSMTGTGYSTLNIPGVIDFTVLDFYYVTGPDLDDKIDIYVANRGGPILPVTANSDSKTDVLYAMPYAPDRAEIGPGSLGILYGSDRIPVRSRGVEPRSPLAVTTRLFPNPSMTQTTIELRSQVSAATVRVYNLLGQEVMPAVHIGLGARALSLDVSKLPSGSYQVELAGDSIHEFLPLQVIH